MTELPGRLLHLLAQEIEGRKFLASFFIDIKIDIVTHGVCRPEGEDASRAQQIFRDNLIEELFGVIKKFPRLVSDHRIIKDRRVTAA